MRISSSLSLLSCAIGFLSILTPVFYNTQGYALTWIDIQESPPLWIFIVATFVVSMHDIKWFDGIRFIRKSDLRVVRVILIAIAFMMAFAMELAVNVRLTPYTFWSQSLFFQLPYQSTILLNYNILNYQTQVAIIETVIFRASIGYHLIRACRMILLVAFILSFLEKSPRKVRLSSLKAKVEEIKDTQSQP